eukprot:3206182-Rhodomonas_salina.1
MSAAEMHHWLVCSVWVRVQRNARPEHPAVGNAGPVLGLIIAWIGSGVGGLHGHEWGKKSRTFGSVRAAGV